MERGLPIRSMSVRPARELLAFAQPDVLKEEPLADINKPQLDFPFTPIEGSGMGAKTGPGFGYSIEKAHELIQNRYNLAPQSIAITLPRLLADERCRALIRQLRTDGLLDWQILLVVANIVIQYQIEEKYVLPTSEADFHTMNKRMRERLFRAEEADDKPFDLDRLNEESVSMQQIQQHMVILLSWGLQNNRRTPDWEAVKRLLSERYGYQTDDVPHDDPFPGLDV